MTDETPEPAPRLKPRQPPPPLTRSVHGPLLPHAAVLDELASPAGVLLWRLLQDTTLWSAAEASGRDGLFADAALASAGVVPEVEEELDALGVLVRDPHPDAAPLIARMCDRVRAWAEGRGLRGTALAFAQAAALADPADARCAYEVGRLARGRAEYARAEVWYQRAVVLARRSGDAEAWALGLSGLANMHAQRGNYPLARRLGQQAVRLARRHSLPEVLGITSHGLAALQFEMGDVQNGMRSIRRAIQALGADHPRSPHVAHDAAVALMDHLGAFATAGGMFRVLLPHFAQAAERRVVLANLARVAGATGQRQIFEAIWTDTWPVLKNSAESMSTNALIALGRGAVGLGDWRSARVAAERALTLAHEQRDGKSVFLAESILSACESERQLQVGHLPALPTAGDESATVAMARELSQILRSRSSAPDLLLEKFCSVLDHPADPNRAYELGRALRLAGEYEHAEAWLEHAIHVAESVGDRVAKVLCLAGIGNLHAARGDLVLAFEFHQRRLDLARDAGLRELEGDALVDLTAVSFAMDQGSAGFAFAKGALDVLGPGHPLVPRLAHDFAVYLMESCGDCENALMLFRAFRGREFPPADRLLVDAGLSRAAACAGDAQLFEDTWAAVWNQVTGNSAERAPTGVFIQLAHGALNRGHYDLAEQAAARVVALATGRRETHEEAIGKELVEAVRAAAKTRTRVAVRRDEKHDHRAAQRLARAFATALRSGAAQDEWAAHTSSDSRPWDQAPFPR
jgi:tetratricopeptide (TPR) repeat protein